MQDVDVRLVAVSGMLALYPQPMTDSLSFA